MRASGLKFTYVWLCHILLKIKQHGVLDCMYEILPPLPRKDNKTSLYSPSPQLAGSHRDTE